MMRDPFEELGIGSRSITSTDEKNVSKVMMPFLN